MDIKQYPQLKKTMIDSMCELSKIENAMPDPIALAQLNFPYSEGRKAIRLLYIAKWERCKEIVNCLDSLIKIEDVISEIKNDKQRWLMQLKYINGLTLEQAAEQMDISARHAQRIHRQALLNLENQK